MSKNTTATIKMYRIGELGDCFLLTFKNGSSYSNMLIDCGAFRQSKKRLREIATNIKEQLNGNKLDVVVGTHQHNDHINGFVHAEDIFKEITIDQVWLSWLDNPKDKQAREIGDMFNNFATKLGLAADKLEKISSKKGANFKEASSRLTETLQAAGVREKATNKFPAVTPQKAMGTLKKLGKKPVAYLKPGQILEMPGLPVGMIKIYVLGPPRNEDLLFDEKPDKSQTYDPHKLQMMNQLADKFLSAMTNFTPGDDYSDEEHFPFNNKFKLREKEINKKVTDRYRDTASSWRTISNEWLEQAARMGLWLDDWTNNSSLVLAIELVNSGKFLLFVGDAMTGNWVSWEDVKFENNVSIDDILSRTVLYKVGHHASHNGSLKPMCEKMTHEHLIAMITVDKTDGNITKDKGWKMPAKKLNTRLVELTRNRVLRMDDTFDKDCNPVKEPAKSSWKKAGVNPVYNDMFVEVTINDTEDGTTISKVKPNNSLSSVSKNKKSPASKRLALIETDTTLDVKERIITASSLNIEVNDLSDDLLLKENLNYTTDNLHILETLLEEYVNGRNSAIHVKSSDISTNKSVGSIVKMVKTKLNEI